MISDTFPKLRIVEAIVDKLAADSGLISLTDDGEPDNYGARHRIGQMLNEPGSPGRTPFVGVQVSGTSPLIPSEGRVHVFRSTLLIWVFSKNELRCEQLGDRIQFLLTTPGDDDCNGFWDFTNDHIRNLSTEFEFRDFPLYENDSDTYTTLIQSQIIWSDVPCNLDVDIPSTELCPLPQDTDPVDEECLDLPESISPTSFSIPENEPMPTILGALTTTGGTAPVNYSIIVGDDSDLFGIASDSLTFNDPSLNYDTQNTYTVVVRVTDSNGETHDELITLSITDV